MLTFLKKIRKSLIESGSARKYLLYALGEIALVVIGILIALQINNWNQQNLDRYRATEYHKRLIEDLDFIIESNNSINETAIKVLNSITQTVEILEKGEIENNEEEQVINYTMLMFTRLSRQISNISTWEEMKNNGDINLIYNVELRKNVDALQSFINLAHEVFSKHASAIRNNYTVFFKYARTYVDGETLEEIVVSDFEAMAADPQYINQFSSNLSSWRSVANFAKNIANKADELKNQIQKELKSMSL